METLPFHIPYEDIKVGDTASMTVAIHQEQMNEYARIYGDLDSFHLSKQLTSATLYEKQVCQGCLLTGHFSLLVAQKLSGFGSVLCDFSTRFLRPIYLDDSVEYSITVMEKWPKRKLLMRATAVNEAGELCIEGQVIVKTLN